MKIVDWLKDILGFGEDDFDDIEINFTSESAESIMESLSKASKRRRTLNMNDKAQREQYVREYCDMMAVASKDVDAQKVEYQQVTQRIADLEEFEKLPMADKGQVRIRANKIIKIEQENSSYTRPAKKITEAQYREMERLAEQGYDGLPVCMAKTQYSFSDNPALLGAPTGFRITVKKVKVSAGAGFIVAQTGDIMTMPGLPKVPAAENIDVDADGKISGLF